MHYHQRTLLIILSGLLCGFIILVTQIYQGARHDTEEVRNLICTAKSNIYIKPRELMLNGTLVLDLKSNRIAIHYAVQDQQREQHLFFQDVAITPLNRTGMKTYTFRVKAVHRFNSDTTGDMFSWLRILQPATVNELTINKIGQRAYLFSLNRQIYNFCTTSGSAKA
ncbi:MAG: hypothetical protein KIB03_12635 [Citrobacter freundii]|uniref:hypothetical protein n=1 Tax=Citrobacter werkmanii TaxID=67827 RepID=UPI000A1193F4|nr:hypothetical protein [Citrobacter werkmanii]MBS6075715.1 hypothetical protein [Citrobacter freundii]MBY6244243.1 hypothetical protein [Citrobacter werkmanii]MBY6250299.1 hypothetical protein [Citrobacter werkmanii]ORT77636.1 hypothetical protein BO998_02985 [Citrobacter werkmanii]OSP17650.1 hypothetical protein B6S66_18150 [Citrobacter werkmanii]